jgi:hypothetical protein
VLTFDAVDRGGGGGGGDNAKLAADDLRKTIAGRCTGAGAGAGPRRLGAVTGCRFFGMDEFLLVSSGPHLRLYRYFLDPRANARSDLERLKFVDDSRYEIAAELAHRARAVTSLAAVNGFVSRLAVTATTAGSLCVWDLGCGGGGRLARCVRGAHGRAPHTVSLPEPSRFLSAGSLPLPEALWFWFASNLRPDAFCNPVAARFFFLALKKRLGPHCLGSGARR